MESKATDSLDEAGAPGTGLSGEVSELRDALARERTRSAELGSLATRLEADFRVWRERARAAERQLAGWEAWRGSTSWRFVLLASRVRRLIAPPDSRRERSLHAALRALSPASQPTRRPRVSRPTKKAVLYLSGRPGATRRYRCDHQAEQLTLLGAAVDVAGLEEIDPGEVLDAYRLFVLHRVPFDTEIERFVDEARRRGRLVIFDTDDLIFDHEAEPYVPESARRDDGLRRHAQALALADAVSVSTEPLRRSATSFGERVIVMPNVVSGEMVARADAAFARRSPREEGGPLVVGYLSGTPTHDRDFLQAADAVLWALETYPTVRLVVVGRLDLDDRFGRFAGRIERLPIQPWEELPDLLARVDVNLAPLEVANPFSECKSCVKYLEAGLLGVPTVASPRPDFVRAIEHGRNGLLAETPDEWRGALRRLIESADFRREVGQNAWEDVRARHTARALSRAARDALRALVGAADAPLTINWLVREPAAEEGDDARSPLGLARHLAQRGHTVRVYVNPPRPEADRFEPGRLAGRIDFPPRLEVVWGHDRIAPADITIATDVVSALVLAGHEESLFRCLYVSGPGSDAGETAPVPLLTICTTAEAAERLTRTGGQVEVLEGDSPGNRLEEILDEACFVRLAARSDARAGLP